ncbi:MAG: hypothetical protein WBQ23_01800 [Bacteroidota bacterium]
MSACSSIDLPTVEESNARIQRLKSDLAMAERPLLAYEQQRFKLKRDMSTTIDPSMLNRILSGVAGSRSDDMRIDFPATRPLIEERTTVFGISYANRLDIDSGTVTLNLKKAAITGVRKGALRVFLELEGEGRIAVSGKYTGIPASASPRIELALRDTVTFYIKTGKDGALTLTPAKQKIILTATFHVNLLGWEIPWSEDTPLQLNEIVAPVTIPGMLSGAIRLPAPAKEFSRGRMEFVTVPIEIVRPEAGIEEGKIVLEADVVYR